MIEHATPDDLQDRLDPLDDQMDQCSCSSEKPRPQSPVEELPVDDVTKQNSAEEPQYDSLPCQHQTDPVPPEHAVDTIREHEIDSIPEHEASDDCEENPKTNRESDSQRDGVELISESNKPARSLSNKSSGTLATKINLPEPAQAEGLEDSTRKFGCADTGGTSPYFFSPAVLSHSQPGSRRSRFVILFLLRLQFSAIARKMRSSFYKFSSRFR